MREKERKRKENVTKAGEEGDLEKRTGGDDDAQIGPQQGVQSTIPCVLSLSHNHDTHALSRSLTHGYVAENPLVPPNK
jgi:hypothetical protein